MKADFSRIPLDPPGDYAGVLAQQGRVWLDADWNEEVFTRVRALRRVTADVLGAGGAPAPGTGFQVRPCDAAENQADFLIGGGPGPAGHYYVGGTLCINPATVRYSQQSAYP